MISDFHYCNTVAGHIVHDENDENDEDDEDAPIRYCGLYFVINVYVKFCKIYVCEEDRLTG